MFTFPFNPCIGIHFYHALVLLGFGVGVLLLQPGWVLKPKRSASIKKNDDAASRSTHSVLVKDLAIYRITGLWVACAGAISSYLVVDSLDESSQTAGIRSFCSLLFAVVHTVETVVKIGAGNGPLLFAANAQFALLMVAAWMWESV